MVDYMNLTEGEAQVRQDAQMDAEAKYENDMSEMEADRQELEAQLSAAQAIIDKLPKTADGVPVVPGMKVWWSHSNGNIDDAEVCELRDGGCGVIIWDEATGRLAHHLEYVACYSTREAAETAQKEGKA